MFLTFLGTGTSTGVPQVGCSCEVCRSADPRDTRSRCSALLQTDAGHLILIDCGPDFRFQILRYLREESARHPEPFERRPEYHRLPSGDAAQPPVCLPAIDAVLITHEHYDHVGGLDDLRPFSVVRPITIAAEQEVAQHIHQHMAYCFRENPYPGSPQLRLKEVCPGEPFSVGDVEVTPIRVYHGNLPIVGFRIGALAYITDMSTLPADQMDYLAGVGTLVVNGLRRARHATHQTIEEAVRFANMVGAPHTYLIHMSHGAGLHARSSELLGNKSIAFAYDGLRVEV